MCSTLSILWSMISYLIVPIRNKTKSTYTSRVSLQWRHPKLAQLNAVTSFATDSVCIDLVRLLIMVPVIPAWSILSYSFDLHRQEETEPSQNTKSHVSSMTTSSAGAVKCHHVIRSWLYVLISSFTDHGAHEYLFNSHYSSSRSCLAASFFRLSTFFCTYRCMLCACLAR